MQVPNYSMAGKLLYWNTITMCYIISHIIQNHNDDSEKKVWNSNLSLQTLVIGGDPL